MHDPYKPTVNFPGGYSMNVTPAQMADAFWSMKSDEMADFFNELEKIAGGRLCLQMAHVVDVIQQRSASGEYGCLNGFQTMLSHAQAYHESAAEMRAYEAKSEIAQMVRGMRLPELASLAGAAQ